MNEKSKLFLYGVKSKIHDFYQDIFDEKFLVELNGYDEEEILELEGFIHLNQEKSNNSSTFKTDYWGWVDSVQGFYRLVLIQPTWAMFTMQFPGGKEEILKSESKREGKAVRLNIKEKR